MGALLVAILATSGALCVGGLVQVYYSGAPLLSAWNWSAVCSFLVVFLGAGWILQRVLIRRNG
jgi:hypothetical protein